MRKLLGDRTLLVIPEPHCRAPRVVQRNVGAGHGENWPLKPLQLSQQQQPALDATPWHAVAHGREAQPLARALFDDRPVFECASSRASRALLALKWLEEPEPARCAGEAPELATAQVPRDLYEDVVAEERQVAPFHPAYQSQRELACLRAGYAILTAAHARTLPLVVVRPPAPAAAGSRMFLQILVNIAGPGAPPAAPRARRADA